MSTSPSDPKSAPGGSPASGKKIHEIEPSPGLSTISEAIADIAAGKMVILVDDEDRENEGDLCMAADHVHAGSHQLHGEIRSRS